MTWEEWWDDRGHPSEHDPGPPRNRSWARLFAEVPNYRGLGVAVTGRESFRWHFGPMFYRGRLGDDHVKVLVVGQEGAQDESLAHRSFAGGTGARMQHFLNHLGITRSYLFLNTFCYPIFGQYGEHLHWLAKDPSSPIASHRNEIFDYVVARNDLQLVVAVGTAAKDAVATWFQTHGVDARPSELWKSDPSPVSPNLRAIGVRHPGGAANGGTSGIKADFSAAVRQIERWRNDAPDWLAPDEGAAPIGGDYEYRSAPLPFRDFPFGTTWRLGRGGTSSNRKDSQQSIQLFSAGGHYNGRGDDPSYGADSGGSPEGYEQESGDRAYEPPRESYLEFDSGPDRTMARLLTPDWPSPSGDAGHPSLGFGAIYRGRLEDVTILMLADQGGHDDLFTGRALTGDAGQHLQAWLRSAGIEERYLILRVGPFDTAGMTRRQREVWVDDPATVAGYTAIIERLRERDSPLDVIVTFGPLASRLAGRLDIVPAAEVEAHGSPGWLSSWREGLVALEERDYRKDLAPAFNYDGERGQIPRRDLPYGTLRWQGTSGDRALAGEVSGNPGDYYKLSLPDWVYELEPEPLSVSEARAVADA